MRFADDMTEADEILAYEEGRLRGLQAVHQFLIGYANHSRSIEGYSRLREIHTATFAYLNSEIAAANELIQEIRGEEE